jgi:predicted transcriptional regulator
MSLHGDVRIGEVRDYTQEQQESPTEADIERVATYLQEHVLADLQQINSSLGMDPVTASLSLHRLIDKGMIGCTRIGTSPTRLFYYVSLSND